MNISSRKWFIEKQARGSSSDSQSRLRELPSPEPVAPGGRIEVVFEQVALHVEDDLPAAEKGAGRDWITSSLEPEPGQRIATAERAASGTGGDVVDCPERGHSGRGRAEELTAAEAR